MARVGGRALLGPVLAWAASAEAAPRPCAPERVAVAPDGVEVPLLRGPSTQGRPAVEAVAPLPDGALTLLVALDLTGACARVDPDTAALLGLAAGGPLPELRIGGLVVTGLPLQVADGPPGLTLGLGALDLAAAAVPSVGAVRFAKRSGDPLGDGATPLALAQAEDGTWSADGGFLAGESGLLGRVALRTDLAGSTVDPDRLDPARLPPDVGVEVVLAGASLGPATVTSATPPLGTLGVVGADVLSALDLAVWPRRGRAAFRPAAEDRSADAGPVALAAARSRYALEEARAAAAGGGTQAPGELRAAIGFDGPALGPPPDPPADPVVRDRNARLADVLWAEGAMDEALQRTASAEQYAGSGCAEPLRLAVRRMAATGTQRERGPSADFVRKLVVDPLRSAALRLDAARAAGGDPAAPELAACATAWGLLHRLAPPDAAASLAFTHPDDPAVRWSRVLRALDAGDGEAAAVALVGAGAPPADVAVAAVAVAAVAVAAGRGDEAALAEAVSRLATVPTETPVTTALAAWDALSATADPARWARALARPGAPPGVAALVEALATGAPPPPWDPLRDRRSPHDPGLDALRAAWLALSADPAGALAILDARPRPELPDAWAARALAAARVGDAAARDAALDELRARFPLAPVRGVGLGR